MSAKDNPAPRYMPAPGPGIADNKYQSSYAAIPKKRHCPGYGCPAAPATALPARILGP